MKKKIDNFFSQHKRMNNLRPDKDKRIDDNIIKDVRNLFRLKQQIDNHIIKDERILFRLKKKLKPSKQRNQGS